MSQLNKSSLEGIKRISTLTTYLDSEYIDGDVIQFLEDEGFELRDNNCGYYTEIYKNDKFNRYKNANPCYALNLGNIGNADYFVWIYVDANGFGIDFDHTFGGNAFYKFKPFDRYHTFANGYNAAMKHIRKHIN